MRIKERIKTFFWETRKIRHKNENLVMMISLYYFFTMFMLLGAKLFKFESEISNVIGNLLTVAGLYIIYQKFLKYDWNSWIWEEDENDGKRWRKRRMTLNVFIFMFILTTAKGVISVIAMDFIYALKGIETPILPGTVADLGVSPSILLRAIIIGPITEELIFREAGLSLFRRKDNKLEAIIFTAIIFGLMHGNLAQAINSTIGGIIYGYIAVEFGVFYSILFHMINNGMVYLEYFLNIESIVYYLSIVVLLVLVLTRTKRFTKWIQRYSKKNQRYSIKRQLLYFLNPSLIIFIVLWIVGIILSV